MKLIFSFRKNESSVGSFPEFEVVRPGELKGEYLESVSFKVSWTNEMVEKIQEQKRYSEHTGFCMGNSGRTFT